jgi:20S proteasome alpha/beta subunit
MRKSLEDGFKSFSEVSKTGENMTSIGTLRLSAEQMIGFADETGSYGNEQERITSKTANKGRYIALQCGRADNNVEISSLWKEKPEERNFNEALNNLTEAFRNVYNSKSEGAILKSQFLTTGEYLTGILKDGKPLSQDLHRRLQTQVEEFSRDGPPTTPRFYTNMIFAGYNDGRKDVESYNISGPGVSNINSDRIASSGSGSQIVRRVLADFLEGLPRERRDDISLADGLYASLSALKKSENDERVGVNTPILTIIGKNDAKTLDSIKSAIMRNVVVKEKEIGTEKVKSILEDITTDKVDALSIAREIFKPEDLLKYNLS